MFRKLIKGAKKIAFEAQEKDRIGENLIGFIRENPVRKSVSDRLIQQRPQRPPSPFLLTPKLKTMPLVPIILAIALVTGGVSAAAEQALPGDFFYPVKISVNEEVRSVFTLTPRAKTDWEIRRLERRFEEVEVLATTNELRAELLPVVEKNIKNQTARVQSDINQLEEINQPLVVEVVSDLESVLRVHNEVIKNINIARENETVNILLSEIQQEKEVVAEVKTQIIEMVDKLSIFIPREEAQRMQDSAQAKIAEVKNYIEQEKRSLDAKSVIETKKILEEAEKLIGRGRAEFEKEQYPSAFLLFQKAYQYAKDAQRVLIIIAKLIPIIPIVDIPVVVPIDVVVPIELVAPLVPAEPTEVPIMPEWNAYRDALHRFTVNYPKDWISTDIRGLRYSESELPELLLQRGFGPNQMNVPVSLIVYRGAPNNASKFISLLDTDIFERQKEETILVGGVSGIKYSLANKATGEQCTAVLVYNNEKTYGLGICPQDLYLAEYNSMLSTFRFVK